MRAPVCETWNSIGKDPEVALPLLVAAAESETWVPVVADVGETEPAVRSAAGAGPTERLLEQLTVVLSPQEVMTTLAVLVPVDAYALATELPEPERESVPLHEYVYEPLPPPGDAVQVADCPAYMEEGDTEQEPVGGTGAGLTVRLLEQAIVLVCEPEVIVTLAVLVPAEEYVFATDFPELESESVPLHEYVYEPVPPDGEAVQVALPPAVIEVGETEHEPVRVGGGGVITTLHHMGPPPACPLPPTPSGPVRVPDPAFPTPEQPMPPHVTVA
jgi:hypothetical protein